MKLRSFVAASLLTWSGASSACHVLGCSAASPAVPNPALDAGQADLDAAGSGRPKPPPGVRARVAAEISTYAGSGATDSRDGPAESASFFEPLAVVADSAGNVYVGTPRRIRKIGPDRVVSTLKDGTSGLVHPWGLALDGNGTLFVADGYANLIASVGPDNTVRVLAGSKKGFADGVGNAAQFAYPKGLALDLQGNVIVADLENGRLRKLAPSGEVTTLAGGGARWEDGPVASALLNKPSSVAVGPNDELVFAESGSRRVRTLIRGSIVTIAGNPSLSGATDGLGGAATFADPVDMVVDRAGNSFVADRTNQAVRWVRADGSVATIAGGSRGFADGSALVAKFDMPSALALDSSGNLFIADFGNARIRKMSIKRGAIEVGWDSAGGTFAYTASASTPGGPVAGSCSTTESLTCTIGGLTSGALYSVTVVATSPAGASAPSSPVELAAF